MCACVEIISIRKECRRTKTNATMCPSLSSRSSFKGREDRVLYSSAGKVHKSNGKDMASSKVLFNIAINTQLSASDDSSSSEVEDAPSRSIQS